MESNISKIEIPDYTGALDEIYNGYVKYYSELEAPNDKTSFSPSKIQAYVNFLEIIKGLENRIPELKERCKFELNRINYSLDLILEDYKKGKFTLHEDTIKSLEAHSQDDIEYLAGRLDRLRATIETFLSDVQNGSFHSFGGIEREVRDIKSLCEYLEMYSIGFNFDVFFVDLFNSCLKANSNLFVIEYQIRCLKNISLNIVLNNYPNKIDGFDELSDAEKKTLSKPNKVGRPENEDVNQDDIERFAKECLFNKELSKFDKTKKIYWHQSGRYEGKPIFNQLVNAYYRVNEEVNLTERQLIKRFKKAYEVIITSMN